MQKMPYLFSCETVNATEVLCIISLINYMPKEFNLRRLGLFTSKNCRSPKGTSAAVHPKVTTLKMYVSELIVQSSDAGEKFKILHNL